MLKVYYHLTKPGIIYGNSITAAAGFFFASRGVVDIIQLITLLIGLAFVIACGCITNNYIDRHIDSKMERTKQRGFVTGQVQLKPAFVLAITLGLCGFFLLFAFINTLTATLTLAAAFIYLALYTPLKHKTSTSPLVGTLSGAIPMVAGYTAVTNKFDTAAIILLLIMCIWQMPHFYAIALRRMNDYKAANVPTFPLIHGELKTKQHIVAYIILFIATTSLLTFFGYTTIAYLVGMLVVGCMWLYLGIKMLKNAADEQATRKMFLFSLIVLVIFSILIATTYTIAPHRLF